MNNSRAQRDGPAAQQASRRRALNERLYAPSLLPRSSRLRESLSGRAGRDPGTLAPSPVTRAHPTDDFPPRGVE